MRNLYYRWLVCISCSMLIFCNMGIVAGAFTVYMPYIIEAGSLTQTQAGIVMTVRSLFAFLGIFLVEKFHNRLGYRVGVASAAIIGGLGFILYGILPNLPGYCCAAALAGLAHGLGGMVPVSILIDRWFIEHKALALGFCASGTGVASIVLPIMATYLAENVSLTAAFLADAVFFFLAALIALIVIRNESPEQSVNSNAPKKREKIQTSCTGSSVSFDQTHTEQTSIYLLMLAILLVGFSSYGTQGNMSVLFDGAGFDAVTISLFLSVYGVVLTAAKCIYGQLTDMLGVHRCYNIFFPLYISGMFIASMAGTRNIPLMIVSMICYGLGISISTMGAPMLSRSMSTPETYPTLLRKTQLCYTIGSLIVGPVPGMIADLTGSYVPAYRLICALTIVAYLLVEISYRKYHNTHV